MMRLRLPEVPRFLRGDALALPSDCCPVVVACVASGTLLLEQAGIETARLDAECLVAAGLGCPRWHLILEPNRRLSPEEFSRILRLLQRRERREPLAYVLGVREFWSLPMAVSAGVLVPRPETETLVEAALAAWGEMRAESREARGERREAGSTIVELCTGSGAVAIALAKELPAARVLATDLSWRALRVARANAARHGVAERIEFLRGDLWRAVNGQAPAGSVDLVVANPPYIRSPELETLMPEVQWEPRLALDGGADGLRVLRKIVASSPDRIRPGGVLLLEIGADQAEAVGALLAASGRFEPARLRPDLAGRPRVVVARRRGM
jgi:release factor glutamine methyltransferase